MGEVVFGMAMSLDGFVNDRSGSVSRLYPDFEAMHNTEYLQRMMRLTGAVVMGRHAYDMAEGDFTGYEFQVPIFVVTHHPPEMVAKGENDRLKFHFVTDSVASTIAQAKAAAGDKIVTIIGGAALGQQAINAGLIDELEVSLMPVLLGGGLRLFDHLDTAVELEQIEVIPDFVGGTILRYRVVKQG